MADVSSATTETIPAGLDPQRQDLARRLWKAQRVMLVIGYVLGSALGVWLVYGSLPIRQLAESISTDPGAIVALYALVVGGIYLAATLPITFTAMYWLPRKYGLVRHTMALWWLDYLKSQSGAYGGCLAVCA
jgi:hypothetical protein